MISRKNCLALAAAAAVGTSLLAPLAASAPVHAATTSSSSSTQASARPFTADNAPFVAGDRVTLTGIAAPGTQVGVFSLPGGSELTTTADADGKWSITSPDVAYEAFRTIVGAYFEGGSYQRALSVSATPEAAVTTFRITSELRYTKGERITMTGEAKPGDVVKLSTWDDTFLRDVKADAQGKWSFTTNGAYHDDQVRWKMLGKSGGSVFSLTGE